MRYIVLLNKKYRLNTILTDKSFKENNDMSLSSINVYTFDDMIYTKFMMDNSKYAIYYASIELLQNTKVYLNTKTNIHKVNKCKITKINKINDYITKLSSNKLIEIMNYNPEYGRYLHDKNKCKLIINNLYNTKYLQIFFNSLPEKVIDEQLCIMYIENGGCIENTIIEKLIFNPTHLPFLIKIMDLSDDNILISAKKYILNRYFHKFNDVIDFIDFHKNTKYPYVLEIAKKSGDLILYGLVNYVNKDNITDYVERVYCEDFVDYCLENNIPSVIEKLPYISDMSINKICHYNNVNDIIETLINSKHFNFNGNSISPELFLDDNYMIAYMDKYLTPVVKFIHNTYTNLYTHHDKSHCSNLYIFTINIFVCCNYDVMMYYLSIMSFKNISHEKYIDYLDSININNKLTNDQKKMVVDKLKSHKSFYL